MDFSRNLPIISPKPSKTPTAGRAKIFCFENKNEEYINPFKSAKFYNIDERVQIQNSQTLQINDTDVDSYRFQEFEKEIDDQLETDSVNTEILSILSSTDSSRCNSTASNKVCDLNIYQSWGQGTDECRMSNPPRSPNGVFKIFRSSNYTDFNFSKSHSVEFKISQ